MAQNMLEHHVSKEMKKIEHAIVSMWPQTVTR